jgi:hypothetical protein
VLRQATPADEPATPKVAKDFSKWREHSASIRSALGVPFVYKPWTTQKHVTLRGVPNTDRARDLLDVAWSARMAACPGSDWQTLARGFYCDLSQNVHMKPWRVDSMCTLCKGTRVYSFEFDCCLSGRHNLSCMGLPFSWGDELGDSRAQALAGQAFAAPCIASASLAFFLNRHAPWWSQ